MTRLETPHIHLPLNLPKIFALQINCVYFMCLIFDFVKFIGCKRQVAAVALSLLFSASAFSQQPTSSDDPMNAMLADFFKSLNVSANTNSIITERTDTVYYDADAFVEDVRKDDFILLHEIETSKAVPRNVFGMARTNLLGDALLVPNIGLEITLDKDCKWSIGVDFYLQWLKNRSKNKFYQTYIWTVDVRRWFGHQSEEKPLTGWHAGIYAQAFTYDIENGHKGYQSPMFFWTFGTGAELGYNMPIGKRWNLDFYGGVGFFHTKQKIYYPEGNGHYYHDHTRCRNIIGITRIGVSLNYIINNK